MKLVLNFISRKYRNTIIIILIIIAIMIMIIMFDMLTKLPCHFQNV
jgi:hypothetical protein